MVGKDKDKDKDLLYLLLPAKPQTERKIREPSQRSKHHLPNKRPRRKRKERTRKERERPSGESKDDQVNQRSEHLVTLESIVLPLFQAI